MWVRSLASLRGLRIRHCCELWCRPAAVALIPPLAWEPPYVTGVSLKRPKKKKTSKCTGPRAQHFLCSLITFQNLGQPPFSGALLQLPSWPMPSAPCWGPGEPGALLPGGPRTLMEEPLQAGGVPSSLPPTPHPLISDDKAEKVWVSRTGGTRH